MMLADRLHAQLWEDANLPDLSLDDRIEALVRSATPVASSDERRLLAEQVLARVHGLGVLDELGRDPDVTEIIVNGGRDVWVERRGRLERVDVPITPEQTDELARRLAALSGRRVDRRTPFVDVRMRDGSRLHAIVPPVAVDGPCLTIRRFASRAFVLDELADTRAARLLRDAVARKDTIVAAGATSSGKTTLVGALGDLFDANERVVTIEDSAELRLPGEHVVRLEARVGTPHDDAIGVRELTRQALRMRPDRIICGEMRGAEAFDLIQALNTGHRGSVTTVHANSPADALRRIETMVLLAGVELPLPAVRQQVAASIDLVVMMRRRSDGRRTVAAIAEVPDDAGQRWDPILRFEEERR